MKISVETLVRADAPTVWKAWNTPEDILQWNSASDDWHTTRSTVDLRRGGRFSSRMEAIDGSQGFDFEGTFTEVVEGKRLAYRMDDEREVTITFTSEADGVRIREVFDADEQMPAQMQQAGWQAILDRFAGYVETMHPAR